jgi:hypothetical protein
MNDVALITRLERQKAQIEELQARFDQQARDFTAQMNALARGAVTTVKFAKVVSREDGGLGRPKEFRVDEHHVIDTSQSFATQDTVDKLAAKVNELDAIVREVPEMKTFAQAADQRARGADALGVQAIQLLSSLLDLLGLEMSVDPDTKELSAKGSAPAVDVLRLANAVARLRQPRSH